MGLTMQEKKALAREVSKRYQKAKKKEKTRILDEFVKTTGYNRKYALHQLANWGKTTTVRMDGETVKLKAGTRRRRKGGGRKPVYAGDFAIALRKIWAYFWYRCGKIPAPFLRENMRFLEQPFGITPEASAEGRPARYRPGIARGQEKTRAQGEKRDKTGKTPEKADSRAGILPQCGQKAGVF